MDSNDRRQRQNLSGYANQQGTFQPQGQYPVGSSSGRFRQQPSQTPAAQATPSAPARTQAGAQGYPFAYDQSSQFAGSSIQPSYAPQDYPADQPPHRAQQYSQYSQNAMYNVSRGGSSGAAPSQYGTVQPQYQQGQEPAIEVLSSSFGSVTQPQYYTLSGQEGETGASATAMAPQSMPSQYSSLPYTAQQAQVGRESLAPSYNIAAMSGPAPRQMTPQTAYPQGTYGDQGGNDVSSLLMRPIRTSNRLVKEGRLAEAAPHLLELLDSIGRYADPLGLLRDETEDEEKNKDTKKLEIWKDINTCYLVALQKQKMMMEDAIKGQQLQSSQSLVPHSLLEDMGDRIVRTADNLDKHGLVDYERGLWEEEIISMITKCLELWNDLGPASTSAQRAPAAGSSRRRP